MLTLAVTLGWPMPIWFGRAGRVQHARPRRHGPRPLGPHSRESRAAFAAFAIESVADELSFVVGPMIATALALALFPAAPVLAGMAALVVGGVALTLQRRTAPPPGRLATTRSTGHVARYTGSGVLFAMMLALGAMFGLLNMSVVAFAHQATRP